MDDFGERRFTFDDVLLVPDYAEKDTREESMAPTGLLIGT